MTDRPNLSSTSTEVLEHEATTLAGRIAAATCRFLLVIAELDRREAWGASWGCASMAHWLSWRCSLSTSAAREHVRVARALEQLPATVAAFERGELSYSKVRAITRVASPEGELDQLVLARTATAAQLETIIRATAVALADPAQRDAVCGLFTSADADGLGVVRARVPIDELGILETAMDKALATVPKDLGEGADSPLARRRAAALVRICESYLVHGDGSRHPAHRNNAVVHVEVDQLVRDLDEQPDDLVAAKGCSVGHAACRQSDPAGRVMLRRRNSSGVVRAASASIRGVPGGLQGSVAGGTVRAQRGAGSPASAATRSAIAARSWSRMEPVLGGGVAIAASVSPGWRRSQSRNARSFVQSIFVPRAAVSYASTRWARAGRAGSGRRPSASSSPAAASRRVSMVIVGSTLPSSIRDTVEVGTPAREARARRDSPASRRALSTSCAVRMGVA